MVLNYFIAISYYVNRKSRMGVSFMSKDTQKSLPKGKHNTYMGAKIANQINTNQQSNMLLSAYSVVTQNSTTININLE